MVFIPMMSFSKLLSNTLFYGVATTCSLACFSLLSCCVYGLDRYSLILVCLTLSVGLLISLLSISLHAWGTDTTHRHNAPKTWWGILFGWTSLSLAVGVMGHYFGPHGLPTNTLLWHTNLILLYVGTLLCWMMVGLGWQHLNHKTENIKQIDAQQAQQKSQNHGLRAPLGQDAKSDDFSLKASPKIRQNMQKRREKEKTFVRQASRCNRLELSR